MCHGHALKATTANTTGKIASNPAPDTTKIRHLRLRLLPPNHWLMINDIGRGEHTLPRSTTCAGDDQKCLSPASHHPPDNTDIGGLTKTLMPPPCHNPPTVLSTQEMIPATAIIKATCEHSTIDAYAFELLDAFSERHHPHQYSAHGPSTPSGVRYAYD